MNKLLDKLAEKIVDRLIRRVGIDGLKIVTVNVQPGDLVIVHVKQDAPLTMMQEEFMKNHWESLFPKNRVVVTNLVDLSIVHAPEKPARIR